jgi:hypothetical protein
MVFWNPEQPVKYSDFEGEIDWNSTDDIWCYHGLYLNSGMIDGPKVFAIFDKNLSWIKDTTDLNFQQELILQQMRFDLYEIYAREFNKAILKSCKSGKSSFKDHEKIGDSIYPLLQSELKTVFNSDLSAKQKIEIYRPQVDSLLAL